MNNLNLRKPIWKQVKSFAPFCPVCSERLSGNNSDVLPYTCSCGEWEYVWTGKDERSFIIKKLKDYEKK